LFNGKMVFRCSEEEGRRIINDSKENKKEIEAASIGSISQSMTNDSLK